MRSTQGKKLTPNSYLVIETDLFTDFIKRK